jgi:GrpB-like predicted nucleotidyltransferase (UPF0157 family)
LSRRHIEAGRSGFVLLRNMATIEIHPYHPDWPALFRELGRGLRAALGPCALRIDHIGSTAVPGLAAKPVIDVQISVGSLEPTDPFRKPLELAGWTFRPDNDDLTKRYFREPASARRTHLHVRRAGSWSEQLSLLFRDFLREHPDLADEYGALKSELAARFGPDREGYTNAKAPFIWSTLRSADAWAQRLGWMPAPSDA